MLAGGGGGRVATSCRPHEFLAGLLEERPPGLRLSGVSYCGVKAVLTSYSSRLS